MKKTGHSHQILSPVTFQAAWEPSRCLSSSGSHVSKSHVGLKILLSLSVAPYPKLLERIIAKLGNKKITVWSQNNHSTNTGHYSSKNKSSSEKFLHLEGPLIPLLFPSSNSILFSIFPTTFIQKLTCADTSLHDDNRDQ